MRGKVTFLLSGEFLEGGAGGGELASLLLSERIDRRHVGNVLSTFNRVVGSGKFRKTIGEIVAEDYRKALSQVPPAFQVMSI